MPAVSQLVPHVERHFTSTELIRDIVIGMSDGLTVPFALAAGLSGAVSQGKIVLVAGLAEIAAGSIAMGLGGYLAARTDADHYHSERQREIDETRAIPDEEAAEVSRLFQGWGLNDQQIQPIVTAISADETRWVDFMMRFELGLDEPDPRRALRSAATIAVSYVVGGLIPLSPYMLISDLPRALLFSVCVTLIALFVFGFIKGRFTGLPPL
ncbi:MAG: VIT1/CCC1 transporter family protein, partial [Acidobacteriota bacterium]|nr:VIT1/CCC1 transporter family protein [Acidobacteriota bacterium]